MVSEEDIAQMDADYFEWTKAFLFGVTDEQLDFIGKRIEENKDIELEHYVAYYIKRHKKTYKIADAMYSKYLSEYAHTWPDEDYILPFEVD